MNEKENDIQIWKEKVRNALDGILYISESEAPLILLEAGPVADLAGIQKFIESIENGTPRQQMIISSKHFLNEIHKSADPNDAMLQANAARFDKLFEILGEENSTVHVIRVKDQIYIATIRPEGSVVIRTETVET